MKKFGYVFLGIVLILQVIVLAVPSLGVISLNLGTASAGSYTISSQHIESPNNSNLAAVYIKDEGGSGSSKSNTKSSKNSSTESNSSSNKSSNNSTSGNSTSNSNNSSSSSSSNKSNTSTSSNNNSKSSSSSSSSSQSSATWYTSPLTITLSGTYLTTYNNAIKGLSKSKLVDRKRELVIHVGLQILQSGVITYENKLHYYSLKYSTTCDKPGRDTYSLTNAISRINSKSKIYTDCFGFVRLTHSIAAYAINKTNPEKVGGLSSLYGYQGSYIHSSKIGSSSKLVTASVLMDRDTGSGGGNRHVAIYLYTSGSDIIYMDQKGVYTACWKYSSVYYGVISNPYKFAYAKDYILS